MTLIHLSKNKLILAKSWQLYVRTLTILVLKLEYQETMFCIFLWCILYSYVSIYMYGRHIVFA